MWCIFLSWNIYLLRSYSLSDEVITLPHRLFNVSQPLFFSHSCFWENPSWRNAEPAEFLKPIDWSKAQLDQSCVVLHPEHLERLKSWISWSHWPSCSSVCAVAAACSRIFHTTLEFTSMCLICTHIWSWSSLCAFMSLKPVLALMDGWSCQFLTCRPISVHLYLLILLMHVHVLCIYLYVFLSVCLAAVPFQWQLWDISHKPHTAQPDPARRALVTTRCL